MLIWNDYRNHLTKFKEKGKAEKFKTDLVNIPGVLTTEVKVLNDINVNDPI